MSSVSNDIESNFESIFICGLCLNVFDEPTKLRDCPHVFCRKCLKPLLNEGVIICPECQEETTIPEGNVDALHSDLKVEKLVESLLCADCKTIDRFSTKCAHCHGQACQACTSNHKTPEKCHLRLAIRNVEEDLPIEDLIEKKDEWVVFKEKNQAQKQEVDENLTKLIETLQQKRAALLNKFDEYDTMVENHMKDVERTIDIKRSLEEMKETMDDMSVDSLVQAMNEVEIHAETLLRKDEILEEVIPAALGMVWTERLKLEIAHFGEQIIRRTAGQEPDCDVIWWTDEGAIWCETGYCSSKQLASGTVKLLHYRGGRYELSVSNKNKVLKTFDWNDQTSGRYLEDRHWTHIPWCLRTPDGRESSRYSTRIADKNSRCAFIHAMMHTLKNDRE